MSIKFVGKARDIELYKKILEEKENRFKKSDLLVDKPTGYRRLNGMLKTVTKVQSTNQKIKADGYNEETRLVISGMANAAIIDRMDEKLNPAGSDLRNFIKNPILLSDHMYYTQSAVGKVTEVRVEEDGVHFEAFVGDPSAGPMTTMQKEVRSLIYQGILQTVSVGFIPKKIIAPEFDDAGNLIKPAIIDQWELLELSIVAVPCNPDSTFQEKNIFLSNENSKEIKDNNDCLTKDNKIVDNYKTKVDDLKPQELIFDKERFTLTLAKEWAEEKGFKSDPVDEFEDSIRIVQSPLEKFIEGSFKTIDIEQGVKIIKGRLKDENAMDEKTAQDLIDGVKSTNTLLQTLVSNMEKNITLSETILSYYESKKEDKERMEDEEEEEKKESKPCGDDEEEEKEKKTLKEEVNEIKEWIKSTDSMIGSLKEELTEAIKVIKLLAEDKAE